jgi:hypothetical protein
MDLESQPGPDVTFGVPEGAETYAGWLEGAARCATGQTQLVPSVLTATLAHAAAASTAALPTRPQGGRRAHPELQSAPCT